MKYVKWIFGVLLLSSFVSFIDKDKPIIGLRVGDMAPELSINAKEQQGASFDLDKNKDEYLLLSFWASYDAPSRVKNANLSNVIKSYPENKIKMVSISYDHYQSIYEETVRQDSINLKSSFIDVSGIESPIYRDYKLDKGLGNYLINKSGIIVAKNISASQLAAYMN
jgi:hypothetical protein